MGKQLYIDQTPRRRGRKRKPVRSLAIEEVHQKNGYYDGKVFFSQDRATYTFVYQNEVIVLHFDLTKGQIYFKGHKLTSLDIHPEMLTFLAQFKKSLLDNPKTARFVQPFDTIMTMLNELN